MSLAKAQHFDEDLKKLEDEIRESVIKLRRLKGDDLNNVSFGIQAFNYVEEERD